MTNIFQPDYRNIEDVLHNRRPKRLPLYEHHIDAPFVSKYIGEELSPDLNSATNLEEHYRKVVAFWKDASYDAVSYEAGICDIFPGHGALVSGKPGPIQTRDDFNKYPFEDLPAIFWERYTPHLDTLRKVVPEGMKVYGGCGYGIFESSQDLVGYQYLCMMQYMDPDLFRDLFQKIGDLFVSLWGEMVKRYGDMFVFFRMGDDLGFKTSTLLEPDTIRTHILPQYKRVIDIVHQSNKKFLLHSCGNIFPLMDDIINVGIDAKHSNEDVIAPFEKWIELYGDRIGLFGGIDLDILCQKSYEEIYALVLEKGTLFRTSAKGFGLGSGNSIAEYVPVDGFQAMIDAAKKIRMDESK